MDTRSMKNVTFRGARDQRRHSSSSPDSSGRESPAEGSDQVIPGIVRLALCATLLRRLGSREITILN